MFRKGIMKLIFPQSKVHPSYKSYLAWSSLSNFSASVQQAIVTETMIQTISSQHESVRTLSYIGKDVIGQVGGALFMSRIGTMVDSPHTKYKYLNNILLYHQLGIFGIISSEIFPEQFIYVAGASNILLNLSFVGSGAVNAKCIRELSLSQDNIGDIYSKISLCNTISSTLGLLVGMGINVGLNLYLDNLFLKFGSCGLFGLLRVYSYKKSVQDIY
jgi:hypothetical protein